MGNTDQKFRIWWMPNPPREPFYREFDTKDEASKALDLLAFYDLYLGESIIFANTGGVDERQEDREWENIEEGV